MELRLETDCCESMSGLWIVCDDLQGSPRPGIGSTCCACPVSPGTHTRGKTRPLLFSCAHCVEWILLEREPQEDPSLESCRHGEGVRAAELK